jgi:hypothetical protein
MLLFKHAKNYNLVANFKGRAKRVFASRMMSREHGPKMDRLKGG